MIVCRPSTDNVNVSCSPTTPIAPVVTPGVGQASRRRQLGQRNRELHADGVQDVAGGQAARPAPGCQTHPPSSRRPALQSAGGPTVVSPLRAKRTVRLSVSATTSAPVTVPRLRVRSLAPTDAGSTGSLNVSSRKVIGSGHRRSRGGECGNDLERDQVVVEPAAVRHHSRARPERADRAGRQRHRLESFGGDRAGGEGERDRVGVGQAEPVRRDAVDGQVGGLHRGRVVGAR